MLSSFSFCFPILSHDVVISPPHQTSRLDEPVLAEVEVRFANSVDVAAVHAVSLESHSVHRHMDKVEVDEQVDEEVDDKKDADVLGDMNEEDNIVE